MESKTIFVSVLMMFFALSASAAGVSAPTMQQSGYGLGARFGFSSTPSNFGKAGLNVSFNYNGDSSTLTGFRLYEKKPGDYGFVKVADFTNLLDVGGATYRIAGDWALGRVSGTNGWLIHRIIPGNAAGAPYYGSISDWPAGIYGYYVTATDSQGSESAPSQTSNAHMLPPLSVLYPTAAQSPAPLIPVFRWTTPAGWIGGKSGYDIRLYDNTKEVWVGINPEAEGKKTYDGPPLSEGKSYTIHLHGDYASSYSSPLDTYFSLQQNVETFTVSVTPPAPIATPAGNPAPTPLQPPAQITSVACAQDAKLCPDGSSVSRVAPGCEFKACPMLPPIPPKEISPEPKITPPAKQTIQKTAPPTATTTPEKGGTKHEIQEKFVQVPNEQPESPRGFFARLWRDVFAFLFGK